jgi:integrase
LGSLPGVKNQGQKWWRSGSLVRKLISARFDEVDFAAKEWVIPSQRMKSGKPHRVPLSPAALHIIETRKEVSSGPPKR